MNADGRERLLQSLRLGRNDQAEYRRGMVLGLTMAEITILLIFLLMFAAAAAGSHAAGSSVNLEQDLQGRLKRAEAEILSQRERADRAENELGKARQRSEQFSSERDGLRTRVGELEAINRTLDRDLEILRAERDRLARLLQEIARQIWSGSGVPDDRAVTGIRRRLDELLEIERVNSGRNSGIPLGSGLPHCWRTVSGEVEFILRVFMHDGGRVVVQERQPKARPSDAVWARLATMPRNREIAMREFRAAVEPILADARAKGCRYAVEAIDKTTNKQDFKSLQSGIWEMGFFQREVPK